MLRRADERILGAMTMHLALIRRMTVVAVAAAVALSAVVASTGTPDRPSDRTAHVPQSTSEWVSEHRPSQP